MHYMEPSHAPRPMDKRELAMRLRELASRLDADADNVGVYVEASTYDTPGKVQRVNMATKADHDQGNTEVWLETGRGPSRTTWQIEIFNASD